jgi:hypothetical protein
MCMHSCEYKRILMNLYEFIFIHSAAPAAAAAAGDRFLPAAQRGD